MAKEIKILTGDVHDTTPPEEIKIINAEPAPSPKPAPTGGKPD